MQKYILKPVNKEFSVGDVLVYSYNPRPEIQITKEITTTPDIISEMIAEGLVECVNETPTDIRYYIQKFADRYNMDIDKAYAYLLITKKIYPVNYFELILREIAFELDSKYPDHISNSSELYGISSTNGQITNITNHQINNYRNFSAFRSVEDAKIACSIMRDCIKTIFKKNVRK